MAYRSVGYQVLKKYKYALKKHENELIECLEGADLVSLAREAARSGIIPWEVITNLESLHPTVPHPLVCRYLFYYVYVKSEKYEIWLKRLSELRGVAGVLYKVNQCLLGLSDQEIGVVFTANHVSDLTEALAHCSSKWKEIGTSFGLPDDEIKNIQAMIHMYTPVMCLKEVLSAWVMCKFPAARPPTLENLERALCSKIVGLGAEACALRDSIFVKRMSTISSLDINEPHQDFEIISQLPVTQTLTEGSSTLLEVQVTTVDSWLSFMWYKDGHHLEEPSGIFNSYNDCHACIVFLHMKDILTEGTYTCTIKKFYGNRVESKPIMLTLITPLDKYQQNLISFYTGQPEVPEDTWPPISSNTYISLALIKQDSIHHTGEYARATIRGDPDDIYKDKENLEYEKAFSGLESGARLLVEGRPGSGKTTLMHKVSQDWARERLVFKHVRLLILVHLRAFISDPNVGLRDILNCYFRIPSTQNEIIEYAEKHSGLGFCFILDGLDEYSPGTNSAFIFQLIKKIALPNAVVIVASRPAAAAKFRSIASRQVEVIGFLKEQISDYINNYNSFSDLQRENLHQYLDQHPNVHHMCYLPIHAAMVCFLSTILADLPQTETEIYREFTKFTILRNLYRYEEQSEVCLDSVEDLTGPKEAIYYKICKLAYEMCKSSKQVMTQAETQSILTTAQDDSNSLGLFTVDKIAMMCGFQKMYSFLHLTFQEYLGASYIASLEEEKQLELVMELADAKQMQQVWKFCCGLAEFGVSCRTAKAIINNMDYGDLYKVQCGFESQRSHVCEAVIKDNCLSFTETFLSLSNFTEIAFIISNVHHNPVSRLSFDGCEFGQECANLFVEKAWDKLSL